MLHGEKKYFWKTFNFCIPTEKKSLLGVDERYQSVNQWDTTIFN